VAVAIALLLAAASGAADAPRAPQWKLRCADGSEFSLHDALAEGPVLVSFWALWCAPCLKELPHLDEIARETAGRLSVVAVNIDNSRSVAKVRPFLNTKGYKFIVPLDTAGDVQRQLQIGSAVPFVVLYERDGRERFRRVGYREGDEATLRKEISALLDVGTAADSTGAEGSAAEEAR
jgi:thiol-disulfide isomerase/thioredoxin